MQMTLQELSPKSFRKLTATASDFHARLSALLESEEASKIQEELCFLKSCGWLESESLVYFSQKTSEAFSIMRGGQTFGVIVSTMDELGYDVEWQVLNSKHFGVPQNRERVFIVGHLREASGRKVFPIRCDDGVPDSKRLETEPGVPALTATSHKGVSKRRGGLAIPVMTPDRPNKRQNGRRFKENGDEMFTLTAQDRQRVMVREATCKQVIGRSQGNRVYDPSGISVTLSSQGGGRGAKTGLYAVIQRPRGHNKGGMHNEAPTLTGNSWQQNNFATDGIRIRRLTPRECFRLQGFPDEYFDRAAAVNSDSQLYKQAGNSVTVNVIYEIAKRLE